MPEPTAVGVVVEADVEVVPESKDMSDVLQDLNGLHLSYTKDPQSILSKHTRFYGWVRRVRVGADNVFIDLYDGTRVGVLMCVASLANYVGSSYVDTGSLGDLTDSESFQTLEYGQLSRSEFLSDGCAVVVDGHIVLSPCRATQEFEMHVRRLRVIGGVEDAGTYPINKTSEKQLMTIRHLPFMRIRAQAMQSIMRICSKAELGVHTFMDEQNVEKIDPNIITMSDCEGAGETFMIQPLIFSKGPDGKEIPVGLTVSSQLPLEALITGMKSVYTAQKSFRAERSDTNKHLAEFLHVEFERAFITLPQLMDFTESFVKYLIRYVFKRCEQDLEFLESDFAPNDVRPTRKLLLELLDRPFIRIKHCDAIKLLQDLIANKYMLPEESETGTTRTTGAMKRVKVQKYPQLGQDLAAEHEKLLVRYFGWASLSPEEQERKLKAKEEFGAFVFVTHWPLAIKSFYMKQCDDGSGECESFDLLAPRVGEMFGGSMREWRYEKLTTEVMKRGMDVSPIQWFLDLRKSGSMPHGGWGMGFARLCMLLTGTASVRDVVGFPVYYTHCPY